MRTLLQSLLLVLAVVSSAAYFGCASPTKADPPKSVVRATPPSHLSLQQLLEEFVHYVLVAKPSLANAYYEALAQSGVTDVELATLVDQLEPGSRERLVHALRIASRVPELQATAAAFRERLERGRAEAVPTRPS